jgi:hypothetical protein
LRHRSQKAAIAGPLKKAPKKVIFLIDSDSALAKITW